MINKLIVFVFAVFLMISGCAAVERVGGNETSSRIAAQQATSRVIEQADVPEQRAERIYTVVQKARDYVRADDEGILLSELDSKVRDYIDWQSLSQSNQDLLDMVLIVAKRELDDRIEDGIIDPEQRVTVNTLLDWVESTVERYREVE